MNDHEIEARLRREALKGEDAERLLSDPLLKEALDIIEIQILASIRALQPNEANMRDVYYRELGAHSAFKRRLELYVRSGNRAKKTLVQRASEAAKQAANKIVKFR